MVLVKQTQTQLRLLHRPYLVWIVAASLVFGVPSLIMLISLNYGWIIYLWWMPLFLPSIIILGFLGLIFAGQVVTCQFDKNSNSLTIKRPAIYISSSSLPALPNLRHSKCSGYPW
jgi:hypothetical protein